MILLQVIGQAQTVALQNKADTLAAALEDRPRFPETLLTQPAHRHQGRREQNCESFLIGSHTERIQ